MKTAWKIAVLVLILLVHTLSGLASADTVTVGDCTACTGYLHDNMLHISYPTYNYGTNTVPYSISILTYVIIRVDLSGIPSGSTITAASLFVYNFAYAGLGNTVNLFQIADANNDWVEGTANGSAQAGSSCYNDHTYNNVQEWAGGAGCDLAGTDYINTSLGSVALNSIAWKELVVNSTGLAAIQNRLSSDDIEFIMIGGGDISNYGQWCSSEYATATLRPYMLITYTPPSGEQVSQAITIGPL